MLRTLPGLYPVTSLPTLDYKFYSPYRSSIFRPYLFDPANRMFLTDEGSQVDLLRAADDVVDAIYGSALKVDAAAGEVLNHGIDLDANVGASWSLTFVIMPRWDAQPSADSKFYPFRYASGNNPRFGYDERNGTIEAQGWYGNTSGTTQSLTYALGWKPQQLIVATLVSDNANPKTELWVNGTLQSTLNQSIKANLAATMRMNRSDSQAGVTGAVNVEAYFVHGAALDATQIGTLHKMFRTGMTTDSRWVRTFMAVGLAFAELEALTWKYADHRRINYAAGGSLSNLGRDFKIYRKAGEADSLLRTRIKNRHLELFSDTTINQILAVAAGSTGLEPDEITIALNKDANGNEADAAFVVKLPPGNDGLLAALLETLRAAKAAGIKVAVGINGSFAWDTADQGWGLGSWNFVR